MIDMSSMLCYRRMVKIGNDKSDFTQTLVIVLCYNPKIIPEGSGKKWKCPKNKCYKLY